MPASDAIASLKFIFETFSPARFSRDTPGSESNQFLISYFRVCSEEALPFFCPLGGFARSVRKVKGLIHTARCRTRKLIELSAPAVSGRWLSGGLDSPVMSHLHCFKSSERARSVATLPAPNRKRFDLGHDFLLSPSAALVKIYSAISTMAISNDLQFATLLFQSTGLKFICERAIPPP